MEQYQEILKCVKDLRKAKELEEFSEQELCMYISSHLDRAGIAHTVITGIYLESAALRPAMLNNDTMIVPMTSETISVSIAIPINNYRTAFYGLQKP